LALIPRKRIGSGRFVERFIISAAQAAAKKVSLQNVPQSANDVVIYPPCGPVQILNQDYEVTGQDVSWNGFGLETILEENDRLIIVYS